MNELKELLLLVAAGQKAILYKLDDIQSSMRQRSEGTIESRGQWKELYEKATQTKEPAKVCERCHTTLGPDNGLITVSAPNPFYTFGPHCKTCVDQIKEATKDEVVHGNCGICGASPYTRR